MKQCVFGSIFHSLSGEVMVSKGSTRWIKPEGSSPNGDR